MQNKHSDRFNMIKKSDPNLKFHPEEERDFTYQGLNTIEEISIPGEVEANVAEITKIE
jgi:hypothetical protein